MYLLLTGLATSVIVCVVSCGSVSIDINIHTITTELLLLRVRTVTRLQKNI